MELVWFYCSVVVSLPKPFSLNLSTVMVPDVKRGIHRHHQSTSAPNADKDQAEGRKTHIQISSIATATASASALASALASASAFRFFFLCIAGSIHAASFKTCGIYWDRYAASFNIFLKIGSIHTTGSCSTRMYSVRGQTYQERSPYSITKRQRRMTHVCHFG